MFRSVSIKNVDVLGDDNFFTADFRIHSKIYHKMTFTIDNECRVALTERTKHCLEDAGQVPDMIEFYINVYLMSLFGDFSIIIDKEHKITDHDTEMMLNAIKSCSSKKMSQKMKIILSLLLD